MEQLADLAKGLEIIDPFLRHHDFEFDIYENFKDAGGHFTFVKYKNERKKFILGYHFSIGQVIYQFDNLQLSHDLYLDKLGFADKKQFQDIQTDDKFLGFRNILYDFQFLVDDFFKGKCLRLKEFSNLQENKIYEYDKKSREGYNIQFDKLRIEKAREEFRKKDFRKSIGIYKSVEYTNLLNELDKNIIAYCERHIV